jgi:Putative adhesin
MQSMRNTVKWTLVGAGLLGMAAMAADNRKEFRYAVGPGASVTVTNESGPVEIRGLSGRQVVVVATSHSDNVEVDCGQKGNHIQAITHLLGRPDGSNERVEYQLLVPPDTSVIVRAPSGPITAERMRGDLTLEGDAAAVEVREVSNAHVHVRTLSGPVSLGSISGGHVEVTSLSGNVLLDSVSGPKVSVNTAKGAIQYRGDFGEAGDYMLTNHSGDIDVTLPASASVDLTARSIAGSVENDFPLQQNPHPTFIPSPGRSFTGTSNSGASTVQLRSFSGKIRVKKR